MKKLILAVDVDTTVIDILPIWETWFWDKTGIKYNHNFDIHGSDALSPMKEYMIGKGITNFDPMDFWRNPNLYDGMQPMKNAHTVLNDIKNYFGESVELVFVSHCFPEHENSKKLFLQKFFPRHEFISTRAKGLVNYDILIDDNNEVLKKAIVRQPDKEYIKKGSYRDQSRVSNAFYMEEWDFQKLRDIIEHTFEINE